MVVLKFYCFLLSNFNFSFKVSNLILSTISPGSKFESPEFLISILVMETLMLGVFCSLDLVIFYLFFEGGLIPCLLYTSDAADE